MNFPFIDLKSQYKAYQSELDAAILGVVNSTSFIGGEAHAKFEANLAKYVGVKHAIGCSSGTSALFLALLALEIGRGDEVIVPSFTFIATAEMVALLGAKPVFADIELDDYNLSVKTTEKLITPKTKAIIAVSIFGQMPNLEALNALCKKHKITLIEDGAQSFGAQQRLENGTWARSCSVAPISCTSFFPSKPLGAYGDGGAVFTNDDEMAEKIRILLNHGQKERYKHKFIGINGRLDTLQAAILDVKLAHLDDELKKREEIAQIYSDKLKNAVLPSIKSGFKSVFAQYSVRVKERQSVVKRLTELGVPSAIHYPLGLHLQEAFKNLGYKKGDLPNTELVCAEILSLPMSAFLSKDAQEQVIRAFA